MRFPDVCRNSGNAQQKYHTQNMHEATSKNSGGVREEKREREIGEIGERAAADLDPTE
jgi:hypothetical protein